MPTYLAIIENSLSSSMIIAIAAGVVIFSILLCVLIRGSYRRKLVNLGAELAQERAAYQQECTQLNDNLNSANEKIQQLEAELSNQAHRIVQIENDKRSAQIGAERAVVLAAQIDQQNLALAGLQDVLEKELGLADDNVMVSDEGQGDSLWQKHSAAITELNNRLHAARQQCEVLEQARQAGQVMLAEKEAALDEFRDIVNEQAAHIARADQDFVQQLSNADTALSKLQAKYHSYKTYMDGLALGRMQVFNELNIATQKIHQLETDLQVKANPVEPVNDQENQNQEPVEEPEVNVEVISHQGIKPQNPLFSKLLNAVKTDFGLDRQSPAIDQVDDSQLLNAAVQTELQQVTQELGGQIAEKNAVIEALKTELEAQQRHISRLEEERKSKEKTSVAAVAAEAMVVEDEESISGGAQATALSKAVEKAAQLPQELKQQWFSLFKKPAHDAADVEPLSPEPIEHIDSVQEEADQGTLPKIRQLPKQLKDLYQKMAALTK